MNLIAISEKLKNLADSQLISEMQRPSGLAPQYLVLSELGRRKQMRTSALNESAKPADLKPLSEQYPQELAGLNSAAAQLLQQKLTPQTQFNPQTAPVPQGNPQTFSAGGLVSFDNGGSTSRYWDAMRQTVPGQWLSLPGAEQDPNVVWDPWQERIRAAREGVGNAVQGGLQNLLGVISSPQRQMAETMGAVYRDAQPRRYGDPLQPEAPSRPYITSAQAAEGIRNGGGEPDEQASGPSSIYGTPPSSPGNGNGIGSMSMRVSGTPDMNYYLNLLGKPEAEKTPEQAAQESQTMYKSFGLENPALSATEAKLREFEAGIKERKGERAGMALLGLGGRMMAGRSQYALTNIGEAIPPTLKDDADFMKEVRLLEKDSLGVSATIEQARRLEAKGKADAALKILEDNRNRIEKFNERKASVIGQIGAHSISASAHLRSGMPGLFEMYKSDPKGFREFMENYHGPRTEATTYDKLRHDYDASILLQNQYKTFEAYARSRGVNIGGAPSGPAATYGR